ncbi:unnamed protein product [Brassica rapa subsp. trilocularis]
MVDFEVYILSMVWFICCRLWWLFTFGLGDPWRLFCCLVENLQFSDSVNLLMYKRDPV